MRDQAVYEIQECLRTISGTNPAMPRIIPDGIYGEETRRAVEMFQRDVRLPITGTVDRTTWNALLSESAKSAEELGQSNPIFPFEVKLESGRVQKGDAMNLVYILQTMLNTLGSVYQKMRSVQVDGIYGDDTEENVRLFQAMQRLPQTGSVDKITWNRLADAYNRYVDRE